jgi:hypothetical protein
MLPRLDLAAVQNAIYMTLKAQPSTKIDSLDFPILCIGPEYKFRQWSHLQRGQSYKFKVSLRWLTAAHVHLYIFNRNSEDLL